MSVTHLVAVVLEEFHFLLGEGCHRDGLDSVGRVEASPGSERRHEFGGEHSVKRSKVGRSNPLASGGRRKHLRDGEGVGVRMWERCLLCDRETCSVTSYFLHAGEEEGRRRRRGGALSGTLPCAGLRNKVL